MADKWNTEATRTLRASGFVPIKLADFHYAPYQKKTNSQQKRYPVVGRPDIFFTGHNGKGGLVEVKTGSGKYHQRFDFKNWREEQRKWYQSEAVTYKASYWLFVTLGDRITSKKYPRITLLITAEALLELEQQKDRKSLSYKDAQRMNKWLLDWSGKGTWEIPENHPFHQKFISQSSMEEHNGKRISRGFRRISRYSLHAVRYRNQREIC